MDTKEGFNSKKLVVTFKQMKEVESSKEAKISLIGIRRQKNGRYGVVITDQIRHKKVWLGTFDTIEQASQAYFSKKSELENEKLTYRANKKTRIVDFDNAEEASKAYQCKKRVFNAMQHQCTCKHTHSEQDGGSEIDDLITNSCNIGTDRRIDSHGIISTAEEGFRVNQCNEKQVFLDTGKQASNDLKSCLMTNVRGTKSSDECNNTTSSHPKAMRSFVGIKRQKDGRYAAVITDRVKHRKVWFGTFDTVEDASQAYFSKKSEFEKLSQQENKENKPTKSFDQIRPESPVVETLKTASMDQINKRIDSQGKEPRSSKAASCLMTNVRGAKLSDECNNTASCNSKAKISLIGIKRQKNGRYGAVITDRIKHKKVWLGTFDTIEEASQAYFSKKSEFEKLRRGNKKNKLKKNCDQIQQPKSPSVVASVSMANDQTLDTASESRGDKRIKSHKTTPHKIGVYKSKTEGRYTSEITNPITKKKIWLGTFDTAEEASHTFQSKKLEFQKLVKAKQQQCTQRKSEKLVNVKQGYENVNCELKSSDGSAEIDVPFSNSSNGGTVQSIDSDKIGTAEEAFHSYQSKKFDLQSSKEVELQSNMPTDSCAGEKQEGQEDDEDLWMGEWVQLPDDDRSVMFSLKLGLPIIDNYGSLLGEFSSLDDLRIYDESIY